MQFEIWFHDLNSRAQEDLLRTAGIESEEDNNWDIYPIVVLELEE